MAVELLISNRDTGKRELIPVATAEAFRKYWIAGCAELQLRLVPLVEDGLFKKTDIPKLVEELGSLRSWFETTYPDDTSNALVARVDGLVGALVRVSTDSKLEIG
jgi:hypothetical protein